MTPQRPRVSTGLPPQPYAEEWRRTCPDYLVYHPAPGGNPRWHDDDFFVLNEHFIVVPVGARDLLATWTAHGPCLRFRRVVTARSTDGGSSWTEPQVVDGGPERSSAWQVPVVAPGGRVYLFYCRYTAEDGSLHDGTSELACRFSDDGGHSWSPPYAVPMRRTAVDAPGVATSFIAWRQAEWDAQGRALLGFTRIGSAPTLIGRQAKRKWCQSECLRLGNLADGPLPGDLHVSFLPCDPDDALTVPQPEDPEMSWANEPSFVPLPDGRLLVALRTRQGRLYYSVGEADGAFPRPEVMCYTDGGEAVLQPSSPAPLFTLGEGRYLLVFNNNDGRVFGAEEVHHPLNRRPCYLAVGTFEREAKQPIRFSEPTLFIDNDGIPVDLVGNEPRFEAAAYGSLTRRGNDWTFWYPDRKHYLVAKRIPAELLVP